MPPKGYRSPTTLARREAAYLFLEANQPASVRAVAYHLFVKKLIPDMGKPRTNRVSEILVEAREEGVIPWEWLVDETREIEKPSTWADPSTFLRAVRRSYRKDRWQTQPERILAVVEKGTIGSTLRPLLAGYDIGYLVTHGFSSATLVKDLADQSLVGEQPLILLYLGDFDPSGCRMSDEDLPERLRRYGGEVELRRLGITREQIRDLDLPTFSVHDKVENKNYQWFLDTHGETCCELDAMPPSMVRELLEVEIRSRIDWDAWEDGEREEEAEQRRLAAFVDRWSA